MKKHKRMLVLGLLVAMVSLSYAQTTDGRYGSQKEETWTWYHADTGHENPIVIMVHGGGWRYGDKERQSVVGAKVPFFQSKGLDVVSINYPMLPETPVVAQIEEIHKAVDAVRYQASRYGGNKDKVILMGHSAGAHLVTMVSMNRRDILGTVSLDSAVYDVESIMNKPHLPLYDAAFRGVDMEAVSPIKNINKGAAPMVGVCSTQRTLACWETQKFALAFGKMKVLKEDKSHGAINDDLGKPGAYTDNVWKEIQGWLQL